MAKPKLVAIVEEPLRVDLAGGLSGHHILVDPGSLTWGLLEDLESGKHRVMLDAISRCIVGGDLPTGTDREGLRRLKPDAVASLISGVGQAYKL